MGISTSVILTLDSTLQSILASVFPHHQPTGVLHGLASIAKHHKAPRDGSNETFERRTRKPEQGCETPPVAQTSEESKVSSRMRSKMFHDFSHFSQYDPK
jgi:hypothetical protein